MSKVVKVINNYTKRREKEKKVERAQDRVVKKRTMVIGSLLLLVVGVMLLIAFNQKNENQLLHEERVQAQVVLEERIEESKDLEQQIKQLNDDDYIARIARSEFSLSEEGEIIFNLPDVKEQNGTEEEPKENKEHEE
ncbi:FtsB family cell division protein [Salinicoccus sp. CNSTN-B1]